MSAILDSAFSAVLSAQEGTCGRCGQTVVLALTPHRAWVVIEQAPGGPYGLWLDDGHLRTGPDVIEGGWAPHITGCELAAMGSCSVTGCINRPKSRGLCKAHWRLLRAAETASARG